MRSKVVVLAPAAFGTWLGAAQSMALADVGPRLLRSKGCAGCHTVDGSPKVGPTFKGLLGRKETVVAAGREKEITVDEAFIRSHILDPRGATVKGFPPVMPRIPMTDEELKTIVAYLETLK
jgi:cytochrome c oxidase subunit 2